MAFEARTRLRWISALACIGVVSLSSCGSDPKSTGASQQNAHPSAGKQDPNPSDSNPGDARNVNLDGILDKDLVQAILDECHKPLAKRMQRVKVTVTLPSTRRLLVQTDLPKRARVLEGLREYLLLEPDVYRLDKATDNETAAEREANRTRIAPLVRMVDAVAFGPLYRARQCQRNGDDYILTDEHGSKTTLQLHPDTLLPRALTYADKQTVHFDGYYRSKSSWVVNKATLAPLGTCDVFFEDGGLLFKNDFFQPPGQGAANNATKTTRMPAPGVVRERESITPIAVIGKAASCVVLAAGKDWPKRYEMYAPVHAELEAQNQRIFGFPMIWEDQGQTMLGAPFKQRDDGKALDPPSDWTIASSPETKQLVVYPPSGTVAERIKKGTAQLERFLTNRKLKAIGPIVAQPFVHLHEGAPSASKLENCKVRMSVRIESQ